MASESVTRKAVRILLERKLTREQEYPHGMRFTCQGDHGTYQVSRFRGDDGLVEECACPGGTHHPITPQCSHMEAVRIVMDALGWRA